MGWDNTAYLMAGVYYQNAVWVHASNSANSNLMVFDPTAGAKWYGSSNSSASWNVAENVNLWTNAGIWNGGINTANNVIFNNTSSFYWENANTRLGLRQSSPSSTLHLGGSFAVPVTSKVANYTLTETDYIVTVSTATSFTITLPTAVGITGRRYIIKALNMSGSVTIGTTSSQTIDGLTTRTLNVAYRAMEVVSDGSNWLIINEYDGTWP